MCGPGAAGGQLALNGKGRPPCRELGTSSRGQSPVRRDKGCGSYRDAAAFTRNIDRPHLDFDMSFKHVSRCVTFRNWL